jgi:hypothetical protein
MIPFAYSGFEVVSTANVIPFSYCWSAFSEPDGVSEEDKLRRGTAVVKNDDVSAPRVGIFKQRKN